MRKAIALLLTLSFVMLILATIATLLTTYHDYRQRSIPEIAQNSLLIRTATKILKNATRDINSSHELQTLCTTYPIVSPDGKFTATATVTPLSNRIDINAYYARGINPYIDRFLGNVLTHYNVEDPQFFKDLIRDTLDEDLSERQSDSEIRLNDPGFANGAIYNHEHFKKILDYYAQKREDRSVYLIPWDRLIYFGNKKNIIDCNMLDEFIVQFIPIEYKKPLDCETLRQFPTNAKVLHAMQIEPYEKGKHFWLEVALHYQKGEHQENLSLIYDLKEDRVIRIVSNPVY